MHFLMTSQSFCQLHPIHTEIIHILPDFLTQLGLLMDQTDYWFCKVELFFFFSSFTAGQEMHQDLFEKKTQTIIT